MKNSLVGINGRLGIGDKEINELKDFTIETFQSETKQEKK